MTTTISFDLPGLPASQNKRLHWAKRAKQNDEWKGWSRFAALEAAHRSRVQDLPWQRVHLLYVFHYPRTTLADPDNLLGSTKPVTDGMVGILFPDDSVKYIHVSSVRVEKVAKKPAGFRVEVSKCECDT